MDAGEHAAFHGAPADGVGPLRAQLAQAQDAVERARCTWLLGVCLGASGRYGEAFAVLEPAAEPAADVAAPEGLRLESVVVDGLADPVRPAEVAATWSPYSSLAASTLGSLHRQLTRYPIARGHDERALLLATTTQARVDARLGLAADAVGLNDPAVATEHLAAALRELAGSDRSADPAGWRVRTRAAWVQAEVALLADDPEAARTPSARAARLADRAGAPRHLAKSLLFVAVAELAHDRAGARRALDQAWAGAVRLCCRPLIWPAGKLLLDVFGADLSAEANARITATTRDAVRFIRAGLPEELGTAWAASTGLAHTAWTASTGSATPPGRRPPG